MSETSAVFGIFKFCFGKPVNRCQIHIVTWQRLPTLLRVLVLVNNLNKKIIRQVSIYSVVDVCTLKSHESRKEISQLC